LGLSANGKAPNLPKTDEEVAEAKKASDVKDTTSKKGKKGTTASSEEKIKPITIDFNGIQNRVVALDLPTREYQFIKSATEKKLFVAEYIPNEQGLKVHRYDVEKEKATDFEMGVSQMVVSNNGEHTLLKNMGGWVLTGTKDAPKPEDKLSVNAKIKIVPSAEYAQIFKEAWRYMRDFLYVDNVHGAPWNDVYSWYQPWIQYVKHRTDLNYVVDILSGEVAIGHSYVSGGDMPNVENVPVGLLGADFSVADGFYRIDKIYNGELWNPNINSPLGMPGLSVCLLYTSDAADDLTRVVLVIRLIIEKSI